MPNEPEKFGQQVAGMLRELQPDLDVKLVGPYELIINGRRLDLSNLYRMVVQDPERGDEIVSHYLDQLFSGEQLALNSASIEFARTRIMPRIQPESIFEHLNRELVAHVPFVNGTVIVFVLDLPQMTVSITTEQMVRWGLDSDALYNLARENLDNYAPETSIQLVESKEGGRAAILSEQDGYDAARILMSGLYDRLVTALGSDFYVATPARDMFVALSSGPPTFVKRLRDRVEQDYRRMPYPITPDFFIVTRDGIAGTARSSWAA